jgi:molybdate transport system substrate-binding protein
MAANRDWSVFDDFRSASSKEGAMMETEQRFTRDVIGARAAVPLAVAAALTIHATICSTSSAVAAEIKFMATAALSSPIRELAPQFERATGHRVVMEFASVIPLKRRIDAGETFDSVVLIPAMIDDLIKQGKVPADTRVAFVRTGLGMAVAKGAPRPDIGSVDALKRSLLNAKSVGYEPEAQPGILFLEILDRLAIAQEMRPKLKPYPGMWAEGLERREVEMAVSSIGSILGTQADLVGSFPRELQRYVDFAAGISTTTKEPLAAKALLQFLLSPTAMLVFKAKGFGRE